jgi:hypothetical protein
MQDSHDGVEGLNIIGLARFNSVLEVLNQIQASPLQRPLHWSSALIEKAYAKAAEHLQKGNWSR